MNKLGKGLRALVDDQNSEDFAKGINLINIEDIKFNPYQPRKESSKEKLTELSRSIEENGIIQPIIVRKISKNKYELIAGERRLTAAKLVGLQKVPAIIREAKNIQMLYLSLIENIQREDLNPVDEAIAYERLIKDFNLKQVTISKFVGKSRVAITNSLRLLKLPQHILQMVKNGIISAGHARTILQVKSELQSKFADYLTQNDISVHKAEELAKKFNKQKIEQKKQEKDVNIVVLEKELSRILDAIVKIKGNQRGRIEIRFQSEDEFDRIIERITNIK